MLSLAILLHQLFASFIKYQNIYDLSTYIQSTNVTQQSCDSQRNGLHPSEKFQAVGWIITPNLPCESHPSVQHLFLGGNTRGGSIQKATLDYGYLKTTSNIHPESWIHGTLKMMVSYGFQVRNLQNSNG